MKIQHCTARGSTELLLSVVVASGIGNAVWVYALCKVIETFRCTSCEIIEQRKGTRETKLLYFKSGTKSEFKLLPLIYCCSLINKWNVHLLSEQ